jgi:hypothetical protein
MKSIVVAGAMFAGSSLACLVDGDYSTHCIPDEFYAKQRESYMQYYSLMKSHGYDQSNGYSPYHAAKRPGASRYAYSEYIPGENPYMGRWSKEEDKAWLPAKDAYRLGGKAPAQPKKSSWADRMQVMEDPWESRNEYTQEASRNPYGNTYDHGYQQHQEDTYYEPQDYMSTADVGSFEAIEKYEKPSYYTDLTRDDMWAQGAVFDHMADIYGYGDYGQNKQKEAAPAPTPAPVQQEPKYDEYVPEYPDYGYEDYGYGYDDYGYDHEQYGHGYDQLHQGHGYGDDYNMSVFAGNAYDYDHARQKPISYNHPYFAEEAYNNRYQPYQ